MPFCPSCTQEYEGFVRRCPDCEVELVEALDAAAEPAVGSAPLLALDANAAGQMHALLKRAQVPAVTAAAGDAAFGAEAVAILVPSQLLSGAVRALDADAALVRVAVRAAAEGESEEDALIAYRSFDPAVDRARVAYDPELAKLSLGQMIKRGEAIVPELLELVRLGDETVRGKAAAAAAMIGARGVQALCSLAALLAREGREPALYAASKELRERVTDVAMLEDVIVLAGDGAAPQAQRSLALHALGRAGFAGAWPRIVPLLDDADPQVREDADEALCTLADDDMGFDADAPSDERRRVMQRWSEHFTKRLRN